MKIIKKENFDAFVNHLINNDDREVVGVRKKGSKYIFDKLQDANDLKLDYDVTILPPKKYFMPPRETLLRFHKNNDLTIESVNQVVPRIIIGIHPYDLEAIKQMDKIFKDNYQDHNYLKKRENSVLVGVNIKNVSKWSFAGSMSTATIVDGYDLMLTDIGSTYAIEIGSSKGGKLLKIIDAKTEDASLEDIKTVEKIKERLKDKFENKLNFAPQELPELLNKNYENKEFWEKNSKDCYSCGTCNLVCPTCYCFDVQDRIDLNLTDGIRYRQWDGCLLEEFALVAGGENFREGRWARYRHRYMRKGLYIYNRFGDIACVGCGRCSSQCVPDIADPARIFNELKEGEK
jgi:heterodisulfide reductase subunit C